MKLIDDLTMYLRFAAGLRTFVRHRLTLEKAGETIKRRMSAREDNFLRLVKRGIFEYAKSPYLPLMKLAGCEFGDVQDLVNRKGLESALRDLRMAGVYVSFEEFKGRAPVVRPGLSFKVTTSDFENPFLKAHYQAETGGTTGVGRRIPMELDYLGEQAPQLMLARHAHGCLDAPSAIWRGPLPDGTGINHMLRAIRYDRIPEKWFTAYLTGETRPSLKFRLASKCFVNSLRFYSVPVPRPEPLNQTEAIVPAIWAEKTIKRHGACCILTYVGMTLRICIAAQEAGVDLTGTTFLVGSEPITPAKAKAITNTGAAFFPTYAMFELGQVAAGCTNPRCSDDMHVAKDFVALIDHPLTLAGGETVDALNFTTLLPTAPLIMLNAEIDDYGKVEDCACGCPMEALGYTQHVSQVASYTKLVSEGVSIIGSDVVRILEEVLPEKFGGSPLDYQLMEEEDQQGLTRVHLVVSPRVRLVDEAQIRSVFWDALKSVQDSYIWAQNLWSQGRILKVVRMEPHVTTRGKHLTLWRKKSQPNKG